MKNTGNKFWSVSSNVWYYIVHCLCVSCQLGRGDRQFTLSCLIMSEAEAKSLRQLLVAYFCWTADWVSGLGCNNISRMVHLQFTTFKIRLEHCVNVKRPNDTSMVLYVHAFLFISIVPLYERLINRCAPTHWMKFWAWSTKQRRLDGMLKVFCDKQCKPRPWRSSDTVGPL